MNRSIRRCAITSAETRILPPTSFGRRLNSRKVTNLVTAARVIEVTAQRESRKSLRLNGFCSRADSRPTFVNEMAGVGLVLRLLPKTITFKGDAVLDLVEPGLYRKHRRRS
jgi:hypothetical protein